MADESKDKGTPWDSMKEFLAAFRSRFKAKAADGPVSADDYAEIERWAISHTGGEGKKRKKYAEIVGPGDYSGLFVGWFLDDMTANALAIPGGEPADQLHMTLLYCGKVADMTDLDLMRAVAAIESWAMYTEALKGVISGVGRFQANAGDPEAKDVVYAAVDCPGLAEMRVHLQNYVDPALRGVDRQRVQDHGFVPHITLAYVEPGAELPVTRVPDLTLRIDRITIAAGDRQWEILLGTGVQPAYAYSETETGSRRLFMESTELAEAPEWAPCLPAPCVIKHPVYGTVEFTPERNAHFVEQFKAGVYQSAIPVDGEHMTKESGALGWITDMRLNDDGSADAKVEWTDRGRGMVEDDRYKYVSPEFFDEWPDPLTGETKTDILIGLALTTRPFVKESALRPLAASEAGPSSEGSPAREEYMSDTDTKSPEQAPETTPAPAATAETPPASAQMSEDIVRRFAEIEAERKSLSEQVATMRTEARTRRFTEEVRGKSDANGRAWFGEPDKHVAFLNDLAEKFGEDSEQVTHYITTNRAHAEQLSKSELFKEIGSGAQPGATTALGELNKRAAALVQAKPELTKEMAFTEVIQSAEGRKLYAQHQAEV